MRKRGVAVTSIIAVIALTGAVLAGLLATHRGWSRVGHLLTIGAPVIAALAFAVSDGTRSQSPTQTPGATAATGILSASSTGTTSDGTTPSETSPAATGPVADLRRQAEDFKRARNFIAAREAFQKITRLAPFDPDGWADLADATAAAAGGDLAQAAAAIDRALELDGTHPKALWLKASLELQLTHYPAAADLWRRLLAQLPADSNDARLVR